MAVSRSGQVMLGLAMMTGLWVTIVSLHLSSNSEAERHHDLLQRAEYERTDEQRAKWMRQRAVGAGAGPAASQLYLDVNGNPVSIDNSPPDAGAGAGEETPFWMGFRSHIDGYNVNQSPYTFPGGAQDHQEPQYPVYYSGKPLNAGGPASGGPSSSASGIPKKPWEAGATNVMGAGGVAYQYPGRGGTR